MRVDQARVCDDGGGDDARRLSLIEAMWVWVVEAEKPGVC